MRREDQTTEDQFRRDFGHSSLCNRAQMWRGKVLINRYRECTCYAAQGTEDRPTDAESATVQEAQSDQI